MGSARRALARRGLTSALGGGSVLVIPACAGAERPKVRRESWPRRDADYFILSRLENEGLEPAPPADKPALIRRATFDLTGLPPAPDEVGAVPGRQLFGGLRKGRRTAARVASLRRTLGTPLARSGALRRRCFRSIRRHPPGQCISLPGLGHSSVQQRHAL